jgi:hypothetical protein
MPRHLLTFLLCAYGTAAAQTPEANRAQVLREAGTDGVLIAMALHCKQPKDVINRLAEKLEKQTMALARSKSVALDRNTYADVVHDGFLQTREVLSVTETGDASYREQCTEVQGKVQKKLAE